MICPRRTPDPYKICNLPEEDEWHANGTCSFCGSLSPDRFFELIGQGMKLGPTDKNYKVYIDEPNPSSGQTVVVGHRSGPDGEEAIHGTAPEFHARKFYFQHLDEDEQLRFVKLSNDKALQIDYPGYFYVHPYFMRPMVHGITMAE